MKALLLATSMLRKNRRSHMLILIITITIAFTASFSCIQNMLWDAYITNKGNVFGNFSHLSYTKANEDGNRLMKYIEDRIYPQEKSSISITAIPSSVEKSMVVGEIDANFITLAGVKLVEGEFPNNPYECAVSESIAEDRFENIKPGDRISIAGNQYTVSGVFQGYGNSWPRSEVQIRQGMEPPDVFLDSSSFAQLNKNHSNEYNITLYVVREDLIYDDGILALAPDSFMRNENRVRNLNIFTHSNLTYLFVALSLFMVTIGATVLHYSVDKERLQLLDLLGADALFKKRYLASKCFFILLIAFILSSIVILLVWYSVGTWIYSSFGISTDQSFPRETLSLIAFLFAMVVIMMTIYYWQVMRTTTEARLASVSNNKTTKGRKSNRKTVNWWKIEFKNMKPNLLLFLIVLSTSGTLLMFASMTYFRFIDGLDGRSIAFESQLDREFDFAYSVIPINSPYVPLDGEPFYHSTTYEQDGANQDFVEQLSSHPLLKRVDVFAENGRTSILISPNEVNRYADKFDSVVDEMYMNEHFIQYNYTHDNKKLLPVNVVAYPNHILEELSTRLSSGNIDISKISSGEEVIIMTYPFEESVDNDGVIMHRVFDKPTTKTIDDTYFSEEMNISILDAKPQNNMRLNQVITEKQFNEKYTYYNVTTKIGGILRGRMAWFDLFGLKRKPYTIVTNIEGMKRLGLFTSYTRIRVYSEAGSKDEKQINEFVSKMAGLVPNMRFENQIIEQRSFRIMNRVISVFSVSLVVLSMASLIVTSFSLSMTMINKRIHIYRILRLNGATSGWIITPSIVYLIVCSLVSIPISYYLTSYYLWASKILLRKDLQVKVALVSVVIFVALEIVILFAISLYWKVKTKNSPYYDADIV